MYLFEFVKGYGPKNEFSLFNNGHNYKMFNVYAQEARERRTKSICEATQK